MTVEVDVPTTLTVAPHSTALRLARETGLALSARSTAVVLPDPTVLVFGGGSDLAFALHLTTLELELETTLVLNDPRRELVFDA